MVDFCNEVLDEILNIEDQNELSKLISDSIVKFRNEKSFGHESTYIMNMIVMLRTITPPAVDTQRTANIKHAIVHFRELQRVSKERII